MSNKNGKHRESEATLYDVYRIVFRHKRKALVFFIVAVAVAALSTVLMPKVYRSQAKLLVRLGRENATLDPTVTLGRDPVVAISESRENEINSVIEILQSRLLFGKVADKIGPEVILGLRNTPLPDQPKATAESDDNPQSDFASCEPTSIRDRAIAKLAEHVGVESIKKSNVIVVSYEGRNPALSQAVVTTLIDFYIAHHVSLNRTPGTYKFLNAQTERVRLELVDAEQKLRALKDKTGHVSPDEQRKIVVTRLGRLEDELLNVAAARTAAEVIVKERTGQLGRLEKHQISSELTGVESLGTEGMRGQLYALELQEQELLSKYTEAHPKVKAIHFQTEAARKILAREEKFQRHVIKGPSRSFEETRIALLTQESILSSLIAKNTTLKSQLIAAQSDLKVLNKNDMLIARLQRKATLLDTEYRKYVANLEQARIDQAMELQRISNINIAQPATLNRKPIRPRKLMNLILGILIGVFGGVAIALGAERVDRSFDSPEEVEEKLGVPTLVSIPHLDSRSLVANERN